jgi:HEAT repeat protein
LITIAKTGNQNIKDIINHLLKSQQMETRRAAALAAGFLMELSSRSQLINQLTDPFPSSTAACYALGKIASPKSLEAIAESLLHGNELLRRAAAESLAHHRSEGHPSLREGATMDDLLVRYAVVHGLGLINEDWAIEILNKMRIDEKEWIVRDLAQHVYGIIHSESPYIPNPHTPLHMATWLRSFAEKHNLAMLSSETALELLLKALEIGSEEEKHASLPYLRRLGGIDITPTLLQYIDGFPPLTRHYTALTTWFIVPPSYKLPPQDSITTA